MVVHDSICTGPDWLLNTQAVVHAWVHDDGVEAEKVEYRRWRSYKQQIQLACGIVPAKSRMNKSTRERVSLTELAAAAARLRHQCVNTFTSNRMKADAKYNMEFSASDEFAYAAHHVGTHFFKTVCRLPP